MKRAIRANSQYVGCIGNVSEENYSKWTSVERKIVAKATLSKHRACSLEAAIYALELTGYKFTPEFEEAYNLTIENDWFYGKPYRD